MAARINSPTHDARTRLKIKTSQLINRLQAFALGVSGVEMTNGQVRAAEVLLRKTVPDLQSVDLSNKDGQPLVVNLVRFGDPNAG